MDEDLEVSTNPIYGNAGYDDEEDDCEYGSLGHSDEDDESETFGVSSSDDDDDGHHSYNPESTDWNNVDFGAEDWSKY